LERKESREPLGFLRVQAVMENVPRATACVKEWAEELGFDDRALYQIQLAVDEACANVVDHAYDGCEPGDMEVACYFHDQQLIVRVRDWGEGFDPHAVAKPDVTAPLEERDLGGLGLFLVGKVMDRVKFTFDPERGNELCMAKRLRVAG
jgi:serine/threonine-protein kinase RsbW